ncbi:hypothetical protein JL100_018205 [Skermanella mucosa]|nr:hypothetical protein [Skermanella mucosa]UEM19020.1 hypothetical protein JL100_018205 [Skermanella mucosa]
MAKGQKKSNREAKKPKKEKAAPAVKSSIMPPSGRSVPPKTAAALRMPM